jgi:hypothetical protein
MVHETRTTLAGPDVIGRARAFFAQRMPQQAAFPEAEGPAYLTLRGQGGEEIALAVFAVEGGTRVRASTLYFDQAVARFLSTLPTPAVAAA